MCLNSFIGHKINQFGYVKIHMNFNRIHLYETKNLIFFVKICRFILGKLKFLINFLFSLYHLILFYLLIAAKLENKIFLISSGEECSTGIFSLSDLCANLTLSLQSFF